MMYNLIIDNVIKKRSEHLFAIQLAKQAYIDQGFEPSKIRIEDDDRKQLPDTSGTIYY